MIVRLATHADRLPKSSQRRSCLLAEPKDTAKSLDEAISVQPLVNSRGAGLAYDFFRFLRRPLDGGCGHSDIDLLPGEAERHRVVMAGDLDVVIDADRRHLPFGEFVTRFRQRA